MTIQRTWLVSLLFITNSLCAQSTLQKRLQNAFTRLQTDEQCKYGAVSLTVMDAKTGEMIFGGNPDMGLAPGSTLKTVTSITAFNVLGKDFQFQTQLGYTGTLAADGTLTGDVIIKGGGDPTLGSWRYANTKENVVLNTMVTALKKAGIKNKWSGHR